MRTLGQQLLPYVTMAALAMPLLGIFFSILRLLLGPTLADRVVALDLISVLSVGVITVYTIYTGESIYLPAAMVVALLPFLATVAFSFLIEKGKL